MPTTDRVVLITGATGVLGRETARVFAGDGARLGLVGTDLDRLQGVASDLALADDRCVAAVGDLRQRDGARSVVDAVTAAFERVDVLIHLVGGYAAGTPVAELDPADVAEMLDQHLWTTLHLAQGVIPGMVERGWGRVLAISQPLATEPGPRGGGYLMAKAAQEVMLRSMARDLAGSGVTANLLIVKTIDKEHERDREPTTKNAQWTTPEEIAAAMVMLCGAGASTVNGVRIPLFGR